MFKVVGYDGQNYAILDTETNGVDVATGSEMLFYLSQHYGTIQGAWISPTGDLTVDPSVLINLSKTSELEFDDEEEEDEDDYEEYEEEYEDDDEEYEEYEEDDEYSDGYVEDEEEYEDDDEEYEDYYDDYEEEDEVESTVSKLYEQLNPDQIKMLKKYYLWYSQRVFAEGKKDPTMGMKVQKNIIRKKGDLNNLRNSGGLWHYAGFVDMGYRGAGYCTLGHPLRYMHLAWDVTTSDIETAFFGEDYNDDFEDAISSNNCIVFGIKCVADFFEVDSECIQALQRAQRESLKDMAIMYQYYADGNAQEVSDSFKLLDEVMKVLRVNDGKKMLFDKTASTTIPFSLTSFYNQFRDLGMIPPKSLVQEIRDNLIGWKTHKFNPHIGNPDTLVLKNSLGGIFGKKFDSVLDWIVQPYSTTQYRGNTFLYFYLWIYFTYEICGWYKYNAETNKDEGGASKIAKGELQGLYHAFQVRYFTDTVFSIDFLKDMLGVFNDVVSYDFNSDLWKSPRCLMGEDWFYVVDNSTARVEISDIYSIGTQIGEAYEHLNDLKDGYKIIRFSRVSWADYKGKVQGYLKILKDNEQIYRQEIESKVQKECEEKNAKIRARKEEEKRLEEAKQKALTEETTKTASVTSQAIKVKPLELVSELNSLDLNNKKLSSGAEFGKSVLRTCTRSGLEPTERQCKYLKMLIEEITGNEYEVDIPQTSSDDIDIDKLSEEANKHSDKLSQLQLDIIKSVKASGKISPKQRYHLENAMRVLGLKEE